MVAAYNAESTLAEALDSVTRQDYENWQVVVVDDGSTDRTAEIAREYSDRDGRVSVISQANAGAAAARNVAIREVDADFVGYLDADDLLTDSHMTAMLDLMAKYPDRDIYSSDGWFVFEDGSRQLVFDYGSVVELALDDLLLDCRILGGGALVKLAVLRGLGGFREHMYGEDYDLWLRALAKGFTHVATPEPLYVYHRCIKGQKSEDPVAGYMSAVVALGDLIESHVLTPQQEKKAKTSIAHYLAGPKLEEGAQLLRRGVERIFGKRIAPRVLRVIHSVSWVVRPLRRWVAGRRP